MRKMFYIMLFLSVLAFIGCGGGNSDKEDDTPFPTIEASFTPFGHESALGTIWRTEGYDYISKANADDFAQKLSKFEFVKKYDDYVKSLLGGIFAYANIYKSADYNYDDRGYMVDLELMGEGEIDLSLFDNNAFPSINGRKFMISAEKKFGGDLTVGIEQYIQDNNLILNSKFGLYIKRDNNFVYTLDYSYDFVTTVIWSIFRADFYDNNENALIL